MIGAMTKGSGVRGLLAYLLGSHDHNGQSRDEAVVVGGTITGADLNDLSRQFAAWRRLNPDAKNPVVHESLSPTEADRQLTHAEMAALGSAWAERMGYSAYTIVSHGDHCHVAALRIQPDGKLVTTWRDWAKSEEIVRDLEKQFGLERIQASHLLEPQRAQDHRRAVTKGQAAYMRIADDVPPAHHVRTVIDQAISDQLSLPQMIGRLEAAGVQVRPNMASGSGRLNGLSYVLNGITVTSKALGRGYTLQNLQKRGISYVPVRDAEALRRLNDNSPAHPQKEIATMETASISPVTPAAPGPHLAMGGGVLPSIQRRAGGNEWWPQTEAELSALGLDVEWWRYQPRDIGAGAGIAEPRLLIGLRGGAAVELTRESVSATRVTPETEAALIALAERRGWTSVTVSGDTETKQRLARELVSRGVTIANPELAEYCEQLRRVVVGPSAAEAAISVQPAPPPPARPKLGLAGWRQKKPPAPVAPTAPTAHQVVAEPPATPIPATDTADDNYLALESSIKSAARDAAGLDDVDGVLTYQQCIKAHQVAELAWGHDPQMLDSYRSILEADEKGYPWSPGMRGKLKQLGEALDNGEVGQAEELFYEANLQTGHDADSFAHRYCCEFDEARELKNENRPT